MSAVASAPGASHGKLRSKKFSTHIDMTPMVDLAFLLLTFFILTNVLKSPYALKIQMPEEKKENTNEAVVNARRVLTLVMAEHNKIYWYTGTEPVVRTTDFSNKGVRKIITQNNAAIKDMVIFIKATDKSSYKNLVDMFDELFITKMDRYFLTDITSDDLRLISNSGL